MTIATNRDDWIHCHARHCDFELVPFLKSVLLYVRLNRIEVTLRPFRVLWEVEELPRRLISIRAVDMSIKTNNTSYLLGTARNFNLGVD